MLLSSKGPGVYYGAIDTSGKLGPYQVMTNQMLMRYPKEVDTKSVNPFSMVLTEFHTLLLFPDRYVDKFGPSSLK